MKGTIKRAAIFGLIYGLLVSVVYLAFRLILLSFLLRLVGPTTVGENIPAVGVGIIPMFIISFVFGFIFYYVILWVSKFLKVKNKSVLAGILYALINVISLDIVAIIVAFIIGYAAYELTNRVAGAF